MTIKQVFLLSLLFRKVKVRGGEGGRLLEGGAYLLFWPRGLSLIRGRALIRGWPLIRGNTVLLSLVVIRTILDRGGLSATPLAV